MKIAFLTENYYSGGLDTFLVNLINHWPQPEDELVLICNRTHPGLAVIRENVTRPCTFVCHSMPLYGEMVVSMQHASVAARLRQLAAPLLRYLFFLQHVIALRELLRHVNPDRLMAVNGGHPGGDSCRAAVVAWAQAAKDKPRAVYNFHNLAVRPRWFELPQEYCVDHLLARLAGAVVGVSKACAESMLARFALAASGKVSHIYNGIGEVVAEKSPPAARLRDELGIPQASPVCLLLATYEPRKGHDFLLRAFAKVTREVPDAHLVMCGFGYSDQVARVRDAVSRMNLSRSVHLLEFRKDAAALLQQSDALLVSSQQYESFGLTIVEAMTQSVPVVATRVGGIPEVLVDGEGGTCVAPDDVDGFAAGIVKLLKDKAYAKSQGERGRKRYEQCFTADRMAREYADLIRRP